MTAPARPSALVVAAIWLLPSALFLAVTGAVYSWARIDPPRRLAAPERQAVIAHLRAAIGGPPATAPLPERPRSEPAIAGVWSRGREVARAVGTGDTLAAQIESAATQLGASPALAQLEPAEINAARIKVDLVSGTGPLVRALPLVELFSMHPGVDGVRVSAGEQTVYLTPHDMVTERLVTAEVPFKFVPELTFGIDHAGIEMIAATRAVMSPSAWRAAGVRYERLRTDAFVERRAGDRARPPVPLVRGWPPRPPLSSAALRAAALRGARYLVAKIAPTGRYIYETDLASGRSTNPRQARPYSLPRHAGTTYFLAEIYRITGQAFLREPIERAFAHLAELVAQSGCEGTLPGGEPFACVAERGSKVAGLGSSALTVVALAEFARATGQDTYADLARRLTNWILYMQRPDGSFAHIYNVEKREPNERAQMLYFSGEAALALARMYQVYGDPRYLTATERALDHLVGWYDFFLGAFFYGEEHWTCIAAEAIWPHLEHDRYREFCDGYGEFLRLQQPGPSDFPDQSDLAGTYGFTPFVIPNNTPAGSRTEAMISAYLLGAYHDKPSSALRQQILAAMHFTLGQQLGPETDFWVPPEAAGIGGIPGSPVDPTVRIDYVQHVCSAMIRTAELLEKDRRE